MSQKPMGVMPLCIIAIFLGIMGILGGAMGIVGLLVNPKSSAPRQNAKLEAVNAEFERRMAEMAKETRPASKVVVPAIILTSALLGAAGIAGVRLQGLGLLKIAFVSNLLVDAVAAVLGFIAQYKGIGLMKWYMREAAAASGSGDAGPAIEIGMQVGLYTGLFFGVFWLTLKLVYYILGLVYFNKRAVVDAFSGRPAPDAAV
jgi:hypothetical protein